MPRWLIATTVLQAALVGWLLSNPSEVPSRPFRSVDYAPHFYAAVHAREHLHNRGAIWGYDPFWMAGAPEGFMSLTDNKLFCMLVALAPHGSEALVFNAAVIVALLSVPGLLYWAARLAGATEAEAGGAALAAIVITFSLPHAVYFWSWGGISFFLSSVLLVAAVLSVTSTLAERSLFSLRGVAASLLALFTLYVHPGVLPLFIAGLSPLLWSGERPIAARARDLFVLGAALALPLLSLANATLLLGEQLRLSDPYKHAGFEGGVHQFVLDWWTRLFDTRSLRDGAGGLVAILPLALAGTIGSPREARRRTEARRAAGGAIVIVLIASAAVTYVVPEIIHASVRVQPYRFLIPFAFFACIPAGRGMVMLTRARAGGRTLVWCAAILSLLIVGNAVRGVAPILVLGHGSDPAESALLDFLQRSTTREDRILVESTVTPLWLGEPGGRAIAVRRFALLPLSVQRELLGYIGTAPLMAQRYTTFEDGWLFGRPLSTLTSEVLEATLRRYAISWIAACSSGGLEGLRSFPQVVEETAPAGDCVIFRVRNPDRSRLIEGEGSVQAMLDRIEVREAAGDRLILKYHWMPGLRTLPPLPLEEAPQPGAKVGFISVRPSGVRNFAIVVRAGT